MRLNEPLSNWTTMRIGGPAEMFFEPHKPEHLADLLTALEKDGVPWTLIGGGANTVAPDGGIPGAVIHTGNMRRLFRDGNGLRLWPGVTLPTLVRSAQGLGLSGVEKLVGVPGHVGGALAMNAGSVEWGIWDQVEEIVLWSPGPANEEDGLKFRTWSPKEIQPAYRHGNLGGRVVLETLLTLEESTPLAVKATQDEFLKRKNQSQPVKLTSAGCAFKNPNGDSAGRLIDSAGLKGHCIGGVAVSDIHANFLVNQGGASAADVRQMLDIIEQTVLEKSGVSLERELVVLPEPL
ncbi:MAG: UDP-N-acetylmuramate dehydrogenase [Planctomycetes bacterium]|nr:UDP-N-acetylmuramate dehydrogenase [Planctomycetota bacterium]MCP4772151.1 UDP-N-acetylmuramate dehydrogenase [Planctomycetota bacterium]MCP4861388.1 UDP-N-acetylmuramate dehydrogenase [Planctomycetota bacterium]